MFRTPSGTPGGALLRSRPVMADAPRPSVVVLLVATNGAAWLPEVVESLRAQTYRPFEVVAVDNASEDSSRAILEEAFGSKRVVALERRVGYGRALAAALKVVADRKLEVDAFLLVHDDAAPAPASLEAMVDTMMTAQAGIVGPKLLEWDAPDVLQDVGGTTDRYGRIFPLVERGELDHGQHDPDHEVLYVNSACMLVSREVVERVGLFDLRYVALRDDYDLCWRARLAGFRIVSSGAAARHAAAGFRQVRDAPTIGRVRYFGDRNMIATLLKNYSVPMLALIVPVTLMLSLAGAVVFALTGRQRAARQVLEALEWNVAHFPSTLRLRRRVQQARRVTDARVTEHMMHGAPRLRGYVERTFEAVAGTIVVGEEDEALDAPPPRLVDRIRAHPAFFTVLLFGVVYLVGARSLLGAEQLAGRDFARFPDGTGDLVAEYLSGWRTAGAGAAGPASPGLVLLDVLRAVCFGSAWLAQRVLLLGLPLLAAATAFRTAGAVGLQGGARRAASLAYALSPLALGVLGEGRLADMVLIAAAPGLLLPLLRAAGLAPASGWRSVAAGAAGLAVAGSLAPWAFPFVIGAGLVLAVAAAPAVAAARRAVVIAGAAALPLFPWTIELLRDGSPVGFGGAAAPVGMSDLLGFQAATVRVVPPALSYALPVAGLAGLLLAVAARRALARALALSAAGGLLIAWAVARGVPWIAPRAAQPLVLAALAISLLVGIGWEGVGPRLKARELGGLHLGAALVAAFLAAQALFTVGWIGGGSRPGLADSGTLLPAFFTAEQASAGAFRVLWLSGSASRVSAALTAPEGATLRTYAAREAGAGADALRRGVATLVSGGTGTGARMLGTLGVRYVVLRPEAAGSLADALERQADLQFAQRFRGARIYRNRAALPAAAAIAARGWSAASKKGLSSVSAAEPKASAGKGLARTAPTAYAGKVRKGSRALLVAETFSARWEAVVGERRLAPTRAFGWGTRFTVRTSGDAVVRWRGQLWQRLALVLQLITVLALIGAWSQRAARERGER